MEKITEHIYELLHLLKKELETKPRVVLAIDGTSAALKSTLADYLAKELDAAIVHCDDFFLPMELRSEERYKEPGGNVHYERLKEEVIDHICEQKEFNYRCYNCSKDGFGGLVQIENKQMIVVEGVYSLHPYLGKYYDLSVFLTVDAQVQMARIERRNPNPQVFRDRWIPLEQAYFAAYNIAGQADLILDTTMW